MNKKEREELRQTIRQWYEAGFEQDHIAKIFNVKPDFVKGACTGLKEKRLNEQRERIKNLVLEGVDSKIIAKKCGCSLTNVYNIAKRNGIKININNRVFKKDMSDEYIQEIRAYCEEGHTREETAEHFGMSLSTIKEICVGLKPVIVNQWAQIDYDRISKVVSERTAFEYVGNYTGSEGTVEVKCKACGYERTVAWASVKHGSLICRKCEERERRKRIYKIQKEKEEKAIEKERIRLLHEIENAEKQRGIEKERSIKNKKCIQCGRMYSYNDSTSKRYCSEKCRKKAQNKAKEMRRRIRIKSQMVDADISLDRLYKKENGICYICGRVCDWNDKKTEGIYNTIICGETYPSIDHVIPLAKGGMHSWANVKLACRGCNAKKSDNLINENADGVVIPHGVCPRSIPSM